MRWIRPALEAVAIAALLAACGARQEAPSPPQPAAETAKGTAKETAKETAFDDMAGTLDKARSVEDIAAQHQQQLDEALQQAEGR